MLRYAADLAVFSGKRAKGETKIYKTLHIKLKMD
jgi:hypothetical protein